MHAVALRRQRVPRTLAAGQMLRVSSLSLPLVALSQIMRTTHRAVSGLHTLPGAPIGVCIIHGGRAWLCLGKLAPC